MKKPKNPQPQPPTPEMPPAWEERNEEGMARKGMPPLHLDPKARLRRNAQPDEGEKDESTSPAMKKMAEELEQVRAELNEARDKMLPPNSVPVSKNTLGRLAKNTEDPAEVEKAINDVLAQKEELENELQKLREEIEKKSIQSVRSSRAPSPARMNAVEESLKKLSEKVQNIEDRQKHPAEPQRSQQQPIVHIHPPPQPQQQAPYGKGAAYGQPHPPAQYPPAYPPSRYRGGEPVGIPSDPNSPAPPEIAELCGALAAAVDLVKRVVDQ